MSESEDYNLRPPIPKNWRIMPLASVSIGGAHNGYFKKPELVGAGYKLINVSELYQSFGIDTDHAKVERVRASIVDYSRYGVHDGDIFFTRSSLVLSGIAACNVLRKVKEPTLFECHVMRIVPDRKQVDSDFVAYCCRDSFSRSYLMSRAKQTTMTTISQPEIEQLPIPVPPLPQQRKIARILTTLDNVITQTEALIAKYQAIKQGLMHDLFTRGVDATGKLRPPQSEAPELYKRLGSRFIPTVWQIASLSEFANVSGGVTLGREISGTGVVSLPYLRVANVQDGYVDLSEIKTVDILKSEIDRYALCPGDVLMTEGGDFDKLGRGTVWKGQISPCLHQNHVFRVRPLSAVLNSDYLSHLTASAYGRNYFLMCAKQTTNLASINATQVKAFPLILPSIEEQFAIVGHISAIDNMLTAERLRIHKARSTKTGLMQDLLTGKVPVKADEVEEVTVNA